MPTDGGRLGDPCKGGGGQQIEVCTADQGLAVMHIINGKTMDRNKTKSITIMVK